MSAKTLAGKDRTVAFDPSAVYVTNEARSPNVQLKTYGKGRVATSVSFASADEARAAVLALGDSAPVAPPVPGPGPDPTPDPGPSPGPEPSTLLTLRDLPLEGAQVPGVAVIPPRVEEVVVELTLQIPTPLGHVNDPSRFVLLYLHDGEKWNANRIWAEIQLVWIRSRWEIHARYGSGGDKKAQKEEWVIGYPTGDQGLTRWNLRLRSDVVEFRAFRGEDAPAALAGTIPNLHGMPRRLHVQVGHLDPDGTEDFEGHVELWAGCHLDRLEVTTVRAAQAPTSSPARGPLPLDELAEVDPRAAARRMRPKGPKR